MQYNNSYPLDIVRRRMQTDGMLADKTNYGFFRMIQYVWSTEGLRGFYKGVTLNWIKVSIIRRVYSVRVGLLDFNRMCKIYTLFVLFYMSFERCGDCIIYRESFKL